MSPNPRELPVFGSGAWAVRRLVIDWSMQPQMTSNLAIGALLMAVWRHQFRPEVMVDAVHPRA